MFLIASKFERNNCKKAPKIKALFKTKRRPFVLSVIMRIQQINRTSVRDIDFVFMKNGCTRRRTILLIFLQ